MGVITLPIKRKWFDMIISGEKKEEYRSISPFYERRFSLLNPGDEVRIVLRNGYSKMSPAILVRCRFWVRQGREKWGAIKGTYYYVFEIKEIIYANLEFRIVAGSVSGPGEVKQ